MEDQHAFKISKTATVNSEIFADLFCKFSIYKILGRF